jgi:MazG family protein
MRILRSDEGCAWDRDQSLSTLKPFAVEELYEVLEAIDADDPKRHCEELGDLLLQIVFQSQIRWEEDAFDAHDVCTTITEKMIRRHPHVFGDLTVEDAEAAHASWRKIKEAERQAQAAPPSALDGVPRALPGLLRATRLGAKASDQGFDWKRPEQVMPIVQGEIDELLAAVASGDPASMEHEFGDLLFSLANLSRHLGIDAEQALQSSNARFDARFRHVEDGVSADGRVMIEVPPAELEERWQAAKRALAGG